MEFEVYSETYPVNFVLIFISQFLLYMKFNLNFIRFLKNSSK